MANPVLDVKERIFKKKSMVAISLSIIKQKLPFS